MELLLTRHTLLPDRTLGTLQIGQPCKPLPSSVSGAPSSLAWSKAEQGLGIGAVSTLEPHRIDWQTQKKTLGKTAIPEGRYLIRLTWSTRYKRLMPFLQDVPHFAGIMIHPGNTPADTLGCILVGETPSNSPGRTPNETEPTCCENTSPSRGTEGVLLHHSRSTFERLYLLFEQVTAQGEDIYITVCTKGQGIVMA